MSPSGRGGGGVKGYERHNERREGGKDIEKRRVTVSGKRGKSTILRHAWERVSIERGEGGNGG